MNDADLGDNIDHHSEVVENQLPPQYRFRNDDAHMDPARWWFASACFPMVAGTLGPVASVFSLCALCRPWRQRLQPGADVDSAPFIADPAWLTIVNAVQLAVAVVANVFLLLNMARRVRFSIAQPITIAGWYISAVLLLSLTLTGTAGGPLKANLPFPKSEFMWSQAFYYGIWAAILYFSMASLMVVTFWGAWTDHYDRDFYLTMSQRTLMLQTIMFLLYLLLGALVFSHIENWNYLDAVYWANVTLFTIGFGDFSPGTSLGRALLIPYAFIGIVSLGLVIASIRSMVLERGRRRVDARIEEKRRRKTVRSMTRKGNDSILNPMYEDKSAPPEVDSSPSRTTDQGPVNEYERRKAEFQLMRDIQEKAAKRRRWVAMAISTGTWLLLWLVGALIFYECEQIHQDWSYYTAFYFCFVSFTTIGYGDETLKSNAGKSFFVFWSLLTLPAMTVLISNAGDTVVKFIRDATLQLGNITILPSDEGFTGNFKYFINTMTFGKIFKSYQPPLPNNHENFLAYVSEPSSDNNNNGVEQSTTKVDNTLLNPTDGNTSPPKTLSPSPSNERGRSQFVVDLERGHTQERAPSTFTSRVRRSLSRLRSPLDPLPTGTDFHFLLISEIQAVSSHLRSTPPRRYSFEQWAWYLRLIGEDERDPTNHRFPSPKSSSTRRRKRHGRRHKRYNRHNHQHHHHKKGEQYDTAHSHPHVESESEEGEENEVTWSWVGNRSPLVGGQEESEWILDRLTTRLRESLSAERRRQLKRKPRNPDRIARRLGYPPRKSSDGGEMKKQQ